MVILALAYVRHTFFKAKGWLVTLIADCEVLYCWGAWSSWLTGFIKLLEAEELSPGWDW